MSSGLEVKVLCKSLNEAYRLLTGVSLHHWSNVDASASLAWYAAQQTSQQSNRCFSPAASATGHLSTNSASYSKRQMSRYTCHLVSFLEWLPTTGQGPFDVCPGRHLIKSVTLWIFFITFHLLRQYGEPDMPGIFWLQRWRESSHLLDEGWEVHRGSGREPGSRRRNQVSVFFSFPTLKVTLFQGSDTTNSLCLDFCLCPWSRLQIS